VATGHENSAVALVGTAVVAGAIILERRRMASVLWAGVAFTAPMPGVRLTASLTETFTVNITLIDLMIVAALVTILPDGLRGWRRVVPEGVVTAFGLLVAAGLLGTFFAPDVGASLVNLVKIVLAAAGSVVAMALWSPEPAALRRFAWLWFAGATISAGWAAATPRSVSGRSLGLTTHPNHFGLVCVLGVGLGLGLALSTGGRGRAAALAGIVLLTTGIGLSGSRAAILGLIVTIGMTAVLTRKFRLLVAAGVVVVLAGMTVIAGIVTIPASNALSRLGGGGGSALSDAERDKFAAEAVASISRHPVTGQGFEFAQAAHNIYLQVLVVGGPLALLSFVVVGGLIVRAGLRASSAERGQPDGAVLAGLTAGYSGYLCSGAFVNILWDRYLWTFVGLLVILSASTRRPRPEPAEPERDGPAHGAGPGPGLALAAGHLPGS